MSMRPAQVNSQSGVVSNNGNNTGNNNINLGRNFASMLEEIQMNLQSFPNTSAATSALLQEHNQMQSYDNYDGGQSLNQYGHRSNSNSNNNGNNIYNANRIQIPRFNLETRERQNRIESKSTQNTRKKQNSSPKTQDILTCFICLGKLKNAHMCPECQKMCCESCIMEWLRTKQQCPHCRSSLPHSKLMKCRFVVDIVQALEKIEKNEIVEKNKVKQGFCVEHGNTLDYFCRQCEFPICSDCGMLGDHKGHSIEKLNTTYQTHIGLVQEQLEGVQLKLDELEKQKSDLTTVITDIQNQKSQKIQEFSKIMTYMNQMLDEKHKKKKEKLKEQLNPIIEEITLLEEMKEQVNQQIEQLPKSEMIKKSSEIINTLEEINSRIVLGNHIPESDRELSFPYELIPHFETGRFELNNYSVKRSSSVNVVYSNILYSCGNEWRLKVYLNGNDKARNEYLSVFLEMTKGPSEPTNFEYRIELVNQVNRSVSEARECVIQFESGACWGYDKFYSIDQLEHAGFLIPDRDQLVLKFQVRYPSYYEHCAAQQRVIEKLTATNNEQKEEISKLGLLLSEQDQQLQEPHHGSNSMIDIGLQSRNQAEDSNNSNDDDDDEQQEDGDDEDDNVDRSECMDSSKLVDNEFWGYSNPNPNNMQQARGESGTNSINNESMVEDLNIAIGHVCSRDQQDDNDEVNRDNLAISDDNFEIEEANNNSMIFNQVNPVAEPIEINFGGELEDTQPAQQMVSNLGSVVSTRSPAQQSPREALQQNSQQIVAQILQGNNSDMSRGLVGSQANAAPELLKEETEFPNVECQLLDQIGDKVEFVQNVQYQSSKSIDVKKNLFFEFEKEAAASVQLKPVTLIQPASFSNNQLQQKKSPLLSQFKSNLADEMLGSSQQSQKGIAGVISRVADQQQQVGDVVNSNRLTNFFEVNSANQQSQIKTQNTNENAQGPSKLMAQSRIQSEALFRKIKGNRSSEVEVSEALPRAQQMTTVELQTDRKEDNRSERELFEIKKSTSKQTLGGLPSQEDLIQSRNQMLNENAILLKQKTTKQSKPLNEQIWEQGFFGHSQITPSNASGQSIESILQSGRLLGTEKTESYARKPALSAAVLNTVNYSSVGSDDRDIQQQEHQILQFENMIKQQSTHQKQ